MGDMASSLFGGPTSPYTPQSIMGNQGTLNYLNALQNSTVKATPGQPLSTSQQSGIQDEITQLQQQLTQTTTPTGQAALQQQISNLQGQLTSGVTQPGTETLQGLPGYTGSLSPDVNKTMLPNVWNSWNPGVGQQADPVLQQGANNAMAYGGMGGTPTQAMNNILQYGGTGPGAQAMSNAQQFGIPSQAGMGTVQTAQGQGPALAALQPFLQGMGVPQAQGQFFTMPQVPGLPTGGR